MILNEFRIFFFNRRKKNVQPSRKKISSLFCFGSRFKDLKIIQRFDSKLSKLNKVLLLLEKAVTHNTSRRGDVAMDRVFACKARGLGFIPRDIQMCSLGQKVVRINFFPENLAFQSCSESAHLEKGL